MARDTLVVKIGGAAGISLPDICADVADLVAAGTEVLIVHGGSAERDALADRLGVPCPVYTSPDGIDSRYTSEAGLDVLLLALAGRVKPAILAELRRCGVTGAGLTGLDGATLRAAPKPVRRVRVDGRTLLLRGDRGGRLVGVDPALPQLLLGHGYVPVLSPPATGTDGTVLNVNADRVAAAVAVALGARRLLLLTAAPGVLADPADPTTVLPHLDLGADGPLPPAATGGMSLKLIAAREALAGGVAEVVVADGRRPRPVRAALDGGGTRIISEVAHV